MPQGEADRDQENADENSWEKEMSNHRRSGMYKGFGCCWFYLQIPKNCNGNLSRFYHVCSEIFSPRSEKKSLFARTVPKNNSTARTWMRISFGV